MAMASELSRQRKSIKDARAHFAVTRQMAGIPQAQIAKDLGVSTRWVKELTTYAEKNGIIDQIRKDTEAELSRIMLPKLRRTLEKVMDGDPEELERLSKAYGLQLKAAELVGKGLGVFKTHSADQIKVERGMTMDEYLAQRVPETSDTPIDALQAPEAPEAAPEGDA